MDHTEHDFGGLFLILVALRVVRVKLVVASSRVDQRALGQRIFKANANHEVVAIVRVTGTDGFIIVVANGSLEVAAENRSRSTDHDTVAIEGSVKYLVSEVLMADLLLMLGFQAVESSITKIFFNTLI